MANYFWLRWR